MLAKRNITGTKLLKKQNAYNWIFNTVQRLTVLTCIIKKYNTNIFVNEIDKLKVL